MPTPDIPAGQPEIKLGSSGPLRRAWARWAELAAVGLVVLIGVSLAMPAILHVHPSSSNLPGGMPPAVASLVDTVTAAQGYRAGHGSYRGLTATNPATGQPAIAALEPTISFTGSVARDGQVSVAVDGTRAPSNSVAAATWSPADNTCYYVIYIARMPSRSATGPVRGPGAWWARSHSAECRAAFTPAGAPSLVGTWARQLPTS